MKLTRLSNVLSIARARLIAFAAMSAIGVTAAAQSGGLLLPPSRASGQTSRLQAQPVPARGQADALTKAPMTWEQAWAEAWARAVNLYRIKPAETLAREPACQNLAFPAWIRDYTQALANRRYGDAMRLLGVIQEKSMCLSLESARGLEFALTAYLHTAMTKLRGRDQEIAVHGALNPGMLMFDQLQYTRRSWWLPIVNHHLPALMSVVATYPKADLGFYAYDWSRNALSRGIDPMALVMSMRDPSNYADGSCTILEMAMPGAAYKCKGWVGTNGIGGAGNIVGGAVGGLPSVPGNDSGVGCVLSAARATGPSGQLGCAAKAVAGMTFDPRTSPSTLLSLGVVGGAPGVKDPHCALSQDAGGSARHSDSEAVNREPPSFVKKLVNLIVDVFVSVFDKTPPVISDVKPLLSEEGADAARGTLQMLQEVEARNALLSDDGIEKYYEARENRVTTDPQANQRTIDTGIGPGAGGGTGCERGSNAARRLHALNDCLMGGPSLPPNRGPGNPLIALYDPNQMQTPVKGALACLLNGGDMPRAGFNDPKCAIAQCGPEALSCPCDRGGGSQKMGGALPVRPIDARTSPNCADPPCGDPTRPTTSGNLNIPPRPIGTTQGTPLTPRPGGGSSSPNQQGAAPGLLQPPPAAGR
jgi:hypothetical protein